MNPTGRLFGYLALVFVGSFLFFSVWCWRLAPNLHRIRAALIYRVIAPEKVAAPGTGKISPRNPVPEGLQTLILGSEAAKPRLPAGNFDKAIYLAQRLISRNYAPLADAKTGPEIKLNRIRAGKSAFCSDYTEAFLGLCAAAGIPAREWGITADELKGPMGHSVVEIYDRRTGQWRIVDPFVGGWPSRRDRSGEGIGIFDYVREPETGVIWHAIPEAGLRRGPIIEVYNAKRVCLFLIDGQRIFRPMRGDLPVAVRQAIQILTGSAFHFSFPVIERNRMLLEDLRRLRICIIGAVASGGLLSGTCLFFLVFRRLRPDKAGEKEP